MSKQKFKLVAAPPVDAAASLPREVTTGRRVYASPQPLKQEPKMASMVTTKRAVMTGIDARLDRLESGGRRVRLHNTADDIAADESIRSVEAHCKKLWDEGHAACGEFTSVNSMAAYIAAKRRGVVKVWA